MISLDPAAILIPGGPGDFDSEDTDIVIEMVAIGK